MVKIDVLIKEKKISKINELELERYVNFFESSVRDNLEHSKFNLEKFPRWAIISGYYAMHDITKLFLAKRFRLKVDLEVHSTTIKVLKELIDNKEILNLIEKGYKEFVTLANDLAEAKKDRVKVQYYTGTPFMREEYSRRAKLFYDSIVLVYLDKMRGLLE